MQPTHSSLSKGEKVKVGTQRRSDQVNVVDEARRVLKIEAQSILDFSERVDENFAKAVELLKDPELKKTWGLKRAALLRDKINVTEFMVGLIESVPKKKLRVSMPVVSDESYA